MLSAILLLLLITYVVINLVLFGSALVIMPLEGASNYLFFGTIILIKEFLWKK